MPLSAEPGTPRGKTVGSQTQPHSAGGGTISAPARPKHHLRFEQAVLTALGTLPPRCWQRIDGLMCESVVLRLPDHAKLFSGIRLLLLEWRGLIESTPTGNYGMPSYRLKQ